MGGFKDLKEDFSNHLGKIWKVNGDPELKKAHIDFLILRCLFEIAGNLDTIALESREFRKDFQEILNTIKLLDQQKLKELFESIEKTRKALSNPPRFMTRETHGPKEP